MATIKKKTRHNKTTWEIFTEHLYALNNSKFFAGIIMLIMNIGSKYISLELSKSQEDYIKYTIGRQILIFAILWMGTRDIFVALILTCLFIIFADYLLNDNSRYCLLSDKCKNTISQSYTDSNRQITQKEINDAIDLLKRARKNKNIKNKKSQVEDLFITKGLYKENFI